jgi:hypothetical protein
MVEPWASAATGGSGRLERRKTRPAVTVRIVADPGWGDGPDGARPGRTRATIAELDRRGGDVIYFSGDAIMCWMDGEKPGGTGVPTARFRRVPMGRAYVAAGWRRGSGRAGSCAKSGRPDPRSRHLQHGMGR